MYWVLTLPRQCGAGFLTSTICRLQLTGSQHFAHPLHIASPHTWVFRILKYVFAQKEKIQKSWPLPYEYVAICSMHKQSYTYCQVQHTKHPNISKQITMITTCPRHHHCHFVFFFSKRVYQSAEQAVRRSGIPSAEMWGKKPCLRH